MEVINYIVDNDTSLYQTEKKFGVNRETLNKKTKEELMEEIEQLRMENAYF